MPDGHITNVLDELTHKSHAASRQREITLSIDQEDIVRLEALAEVYGLSVNEVGAALLGNVLKEVEAKLPYVPGTNVIRVEDDEPIYEDIGPTPRYLEAKKRLEAQGSASA